MSGHKGPSASKSALLLSPCVRWAWSGAKAYEDKYADTTKRDKGTLFHSLMEGFIRDPMVVPERWDHVPADVWVWFTLAVKWLTQHLQPRCVELHTEVYVASDFANSNVHSDFTVRDRKYPKLKGYLPGTADIVSILADGRLLVADWKTGGGTGADKQLLSLAWGLRHLYPNPDGSSRGVALSILYVSDQGVHPVEWDVTDDELELHRQAMAFQMADIGVRKEAVPGIHCSQLYCPHLAFCPGIGAVVEDASESPQGLLPAQRLVRSHAMDKPTSDEHAGYVMARVTAAKRQVAYLEQAVRSWVEDGGQCIADGFVYSKKADGYRWRQRK